jgi:hypothetical protein
MCLRRNQDADRVHLQLQDCEVGARQNRADPAEYDQAMLIAPFVEQAELEFDERWTRPTDFDEKSDDVTPFLGRKERLQRAKNFRCMMYRIRWEQHIAQLTRRQCGAHRNFVEGAIHGEHSAESFEEESHSDRKGIAELEGENRDE